MTKAATFLLLSLVSVFSFGHNIVVGKALPSLVIESKGQMIFEFNIDRQKMVFDAESDIRYRKWSTGDLTGKIRCIYHLAARTGTADINQPFIDALIKANLPEYLPDSPFKTTTILNTDDALWGTAGFAGSQLEDSQRKVPHAYYVNDTEGLARKAWGLEEGSSAVIILDRKGKVLFVKDGNMTDLEIAKTVELIQVQLETLK